VTSVQLASALNRAREARANPGWLERCRTCGCDSNNKCGPLDHFVQPERCAFCQAGIDIGVKRPLSRPQRAVGARRLA
jgi:hypothetical protein